MLAARPGDPFLPHLLSHHVADLPAYAYGAAVGLHCDFWGRAELILTGPDAEAAAWLAAYAPRHPESASLSLPRGAAPAAAGLGFAEVERWAYRWTRTAPSLPLPDGLSWLPPDADDEVRDLLAAGFPDASLPVGHPDVRRWAGLRRAGRLVACAADATGCAEVGFLASIASHPDVRGTGAGAAVTAWSTAALLAEHPVCGLWHMGDNPAAGLYTRLGYADEHRMAVVSRS